MASFAHAGDLEFGQVTSSVTDELPCPACGAGRVTLLGGYFRAVPLRGGHSVRIETSRTAGVTLVCGNCGHSSPPARQPSAGSGVRH